MPQTSVFRRRLGVPLATIVVVALLSGILAPPAAAVDTVIEVSPLSLDFGGVDVGATSQMPVQVTNTGSSPFGPINIFGGAPPTAEFGASQNCQGVTLAGGASCQINYSFTPSSPGPFSDSSSFTISPTSSQSDGEDFTVSLTGFGTGTEITSFTPPADDVGDPVVITGTGFTGASVVTFNGVPAPFLVDSNTQITAIVPDGATTGPIAVTTQYGTVMSSTDFIVIVRHARTITIELSKSLVAKGQVSAADDFAECESGVIVKIQRYRKGAFRTIDTSVTDQDGRYRESLPDKDGKYRALVGRLVLNNGQDICHRAKFAAKR